MLPRPLPDFDRLRSLTDDPVINEVINEIISLSKVVLTSIDPGPDFEEFEDGPNRVCLNKLEPDPQQIENPEGGGSGCTISVSKIGVAPGDDVDSGCLPPITEYQSGVAEAPVVVDDFVADGEDFTVALGSEFCDEFFTVKPGLGTKVRLIVGPNNANDAVRQYEIGLSPGTVENQMLFWNGNAWCLLNPPAGASSGEYYYLRYDSGSGLQWELSRTCPEE